MPCAIDIDRNHTMCSTYLTVHQMAAEPDFPTAKQPVGAMGKPKAAFRAMRSSSSAIRKQK